MASEIVVGIDFGTTYSGVTWAANAGDKAIHIVNDWPHANDTSNVDKAPTVLTYKNRKPDQWGYKVGERAVSLSWFKLLLDESNKIGRSSSKVISTLQQLEALGKSPEDAAADYLRLVWQYAKEDIAKHRGDDWENNSSVRAVLTVPAIWSEKAKDRTLRIAKRAGIPDDVSLVSEPEAAALATLRGKRQEGDQMKVGDCFVVCDAGGGTVDLISYRIVSLKPFQVEECAVGDGDLCGSVYIDQGFERHVKTIVGEGQWNGLKTRAKQSMMGKFERKIKRSYAGDDQEFQIELQDVEDDPSVGIEGEIITLNPSSLRTIFDHVIGQIIRLVEKQIEEVVDGGHTVNAILLVGGFGTNRYLHKRLNEAYKSAGTRVLATNGGWSAICRGATMWGLEHSKKTPALKKTVKSRIARYSYGIVCSQPFDHSRHLIQDRYVNVAGEYWAKDQMIWKLKKGEKIEQGRELQVTLTEHVQASWTSLSEPEWQFSRPLHYCAENEPPTRRNSTVKELCTVEYAVQRDRFLVEPSFKDPVGKQKWRAASFDFFIRLDNTTLDYYIKYRGEQVARMEAKYKEDF